MQHTFHLGVSSKQVHMHTYHLELSSIDPTTEAGIRRHLKQSSHRTQALSVGELSSIVKSMTASP